MYQKLTIVGNLGRDPELRYTAQGTAVCNISVATNESWTDGDGVKHERVTWFRVSCWRRMAEAVAQYMSKGRQVLVEGRLTPDENGNPRVWTDKQGNARASFEMNAQTVKFLGGRGTQEETYGEPEEEAEIPF